MEKRQLTIDILGASFVIQSRESPDYLSRLADYLKEKVEEVKSRYTFADPLTVALLAGLNLADELFKLRSGMGLGEPEQEIAVVARRILDAMDDKLLSHEPYAPAKEEAAGPDDPRAL